MQLMREGKLSSTRMKSKSKTAVPLPILFEVKDIMIDELLNFIVY